MRIARGISIANTNKPISTAIVYDADAVAFFTAASITDTTQKSAVNQLVLDLKSANIWTKMKALYPVVGGVASSHAVNLKTPGTYNLSFATGWTHSSTGMTPNGATYANTSLAPNTMSQNSHHLSLYSRTNVAEGVIDMGNTGTFVGGNYNLITSRNASNLISIGINSTTQDTVSNTDSRGFFIANRTASNVLNCFKNNTKIINVTKASSTPEPNSIYIGSANRDNAPLTYSSKQFAFASIGDGLTDAEASSFYTAVQTYQTTLNRQIP